MKEFLYRPIDIAYIITGLELGIKEAAELINKIFDNEQSFIDSKYRNDLKNFILDILHWNNYLYDKQAIDKEFPSIQKDVEYIGTYLEEDKLVSDFKELDLFFKNMRIQILYIPGQDYRRMKLRTLLSAYGYKRRTKSLLEYIRNCMMFYHIQATLKGGAECSIEEISLDDMITFRVI